MAWATIFRNTTVYVDDALVSTRLDDGKAHDVDPGKHVVKFSNGGRDETVTIVIGAGEQGRTVSAVFGATHPAPSTTPHREVVSKPTGPVTTHPTGARALMITGLAVTVAGAAFGAFELSRVPSNCSVSSNQCAAAPGDPVFADAHDAVGHANIGWIVSGVGLAAAIGGTVWYFTGAHTETKEHFAIAPFTTTSGGGLALGGAW
ncbi:MAG: hypothetical protein QM831_12255 [Kofleriaceae bacterium]